MSPHIEVVKRWLADKDSVSHEELKANADAALAAYDAAANAAFDDAAWAARAAARLAADSTRDAAAAEAAYAAANALDADADYWVKRYEELTK